MRRCGEAQHVAKITHNSRNVWNKKQTFFIFLRGHQFIIFVIISSLILAVLLTIASSLELGDRSSG